MPSGVSRRTFAAASSIANGSPSSRLQMSVTAAAFSAVRANSGLTACARSTNSCTAADLRARSRLAGAVPSGAAQSLHLVDLLAADAEHDPACHQEARGRRDRVQPHEHRGGTHDLLEVVEHDQHATPLQGVGDAVLEARLAVVPNAEEVGDRGQQQALLEHALQKDEEGAVGKQILGGVRDLDRETALPDPARADEGHHPVLAPLEQLAHLGEVALSTDRGRVGGRNPRDEGCRRLPILTFGLGPGLVEALREERGQIADHPVGELVGVVEREVRRGVVAPDARDQLLQPIFAVIRGLDVDELRHARGARLYSSSRPLISSSGATHP